MSIQTLIAQRFAKIQANRCRETNRETDVRLGLSHGVVDFRSCEKASEPPRGALLDAASPATSTLAASAAKPSPPALAASAAGPFGDGRDGWAEREERWMREQLAPGEFPN